MWDADKDQNCETIHSMRAIRAGEITISYQFGPYKSRRYLLNDKFGFNCDCCLCSLPLADQKLSGDRQVKIDQLDEGIDDGNRMLNSPDAALADCFQLHRLLEKEFEDLTVPLLARLCYDAFQICSTHGDQARAALFAEKGYKARIICEGEDNPETRNMNKLMNNPVGHRNFGVSNKWRTKKLLCQRGLIP